MTVFCVGHCIECIDLAIILQAVNNELLVAWLCLELQLLSRGDHLPGKVGEVGNSENIANYRKPHVSREKISKWFSIFMNSLEKYLKALV